MMQHVENFSSLTPDAMLNALESIGLHCDGRLLALNSFENRVYQAGIFKRRDLPERKNQHSPMLMNGQVAMA